MHSPGVVEVVVCWVAPNRRAVPNSVRAKSFIMERGNVWPPLEYYMFSFVSYDGLQFPRELTENWEMW